MSAMSDPVTLEQIQQMSRHELIRACADLLYPAGDIRRDPEPDRVTLGILRSKMRGVADIFENQEK